MAVVVRLARPGDEGDIMRLVQALAEFEREPDAVEMTAEQLAGHLFADRPRVFAHVAEIDGAVVGIALWFLNFSTWTGHHGIYLEDLYVVPEARGSGVADALLRALGAEAKAHGYTRIEWAVLDWNEQAKAFYRRIGGRHNAEWEPWRIDGPALTALQA